MKLCPNSPVWFIFPLDKQLFRWEEREKKKRLTQFYSFKTSLSYKVDLHLDITHRGLNNLLMLLEDTLKVYCFDGFIQSSSKHHKGNNIIC